MTLPRPSSTRLFGSAFALALAAVAFLGIPAQESDAGLSHSKEIVYFSDASQTDIVGIYEITCSGQVISFGKKTRFKDETRIPCI